MAKQDRHSTYADEIVKDPTVISVRDKIDAAPDKSLAAGERYLAINFADGSKLEKHVKHAVGSLVVPMTDEQLTENFVAQSALVLGQGEQRASDAAWKIGEADEVAKVLSTL